ncbi:MAG: hypothetical protein A2Y07_10685 [Planctomycetes bacterium GWF2_50_10]|nr:MAG: hypothetical protein A2Y07_10685 [Planctomycetes bacterium GWF2_50_10]
MFKRMRLSAKLITGFLLVAFITTVIGLIGFFSVKTMKTHTDDIGSVCLPAVTNLLIIDNALGKIKTAQRTLLDTHLAQADSKRQYENIENARQEYKQAFDAYEPLPKNNEETNEWKEFLAAVDAWRQENNTFMEFSKNFVNAAIINPDGVGEQLEYAKSGHYTLLANMAHLVFEKTEFTGGEDHTQCNFGKWTSACQTENIGINAALKQMAQPHKKLHELVVKAKAATKTGNDQEAMSAYKEMVPLVTDLSTGFAALYAEVQKSKDAYNSMYAQAMGPCREKQETTLKVLAQLVKINQDKASNGTSRAATAAVTTQMVMVISLVIGIIVAILLGILLSLGITRPINSIIAGLTEGSAQVASAAGQVSSASQSLAEGATEQAAGLEETSSSLEEMSSMTKQNAENAQKAATLAAQARSAASSGNDAMGKMTSAILDIQKSSNETAKIIKVIDEIAFQTNLLALNAAVEAARAGEAGKGFAVVAEEVRNLAMRSAEAAKNTAAMIDQSVKNSKNGVDITNDVSKVLGEIVGAASKTADLIGEIAASSQEQAKGIDQVNVAVAQMDKITQSNAANAEESASASEELSAQAATMNQIVADLVALVGDAGTKTEMRAKKTSSNKTQYQTKKLSLSDHTFHHIAQKQKSGRPDASKLIPLNDDSDLKAFNS